MADPTGVIPPEAHGYPKTTFSSIAEAAAYYKPLLDRVFIST